MARRVVSSEHWLQGGRRLTRACSLRAGLGAALRLATAPGERAVERRFVRGPA